MYDPQTEVYAPSPYISAGWGQHPSALHAPPTHAPPQQRYSYAVENPMNYPMYPMSTPGVAPMSASSVPSPHLSLPALSPAPDTPASVALSVGNSPDIQHARAVSASPQVSLVREAAGGPLLMMLLGTC